MTRRCRKPFDSSARRVTYPESYITKYTTYTEITRWRPLMFSNVTAQEGLRVPGRYRPHGTLHRRCHGEIGISLPNNQRQHRTLHIQTDVLPCALSWLLCHMSAALASIFRMDSISTCYSPPCRPPALRVGQAALFRPLYWRSPESGDAWYKSRKLKTAI